MLECLDILLESEWVTSVDLIVYILYLASSCQNFFASMEATDSTSSLPYPSVLLQFFLEFTMVAKEVKLMALAEGISIHQYIDGWLMRTNSKTAMPREHPQVGSSFQKPRLDHKFLKIRFISNSRNQIFAYKFNLRVGLVFPTQKENRLSSGNDSYHVESFSLISKEARVTLKAWL